MPSRRALDVRRFMRAAEQRLKEARFLLEHDFTTAAVYLSGYAVECGLKALLLSDEPSARNRETIKLFRGARGHSFGWLRRELLLRRVVFPRQVERWLAALSWWSTDLRYDPSQVEKKSEVEFLRSTEELVSWIRGRL
jgi:HEPN domain-containing protein